jgi:DNA-binding transcriptional MerR regulator
MTERLWFKIGEASRRIGVTPKELRYWEKVIPELRPRRSKGNLRYYHVEEFPRLVRICQWLGEGLTVADCRELLLNGQLTRRLDLGLGEEPDAAPRKARTRPAPRAEALQPVLSALKKLAARLARPVRLPRRSKPSLDPPSGST